VSPIEHLQPEFDVESRHSIRISAPAERVYESARKLDLSSSPVVWALFRLRGLPGSALRLEGLQRLGFRVIEELPPARFALGAIGRFWRLGGDLVEFEPEDFPDWSEPGYAKAAWSFEIREDPYGATFVQTVTRVHCTDDASRRRFRAYWRLVGPFSGLIRAQMLRTLRTASESSR
jgi:hypothetical protein